MKVTMKADFKRAAKDVEKWSQRKQQAVQVNESALNIQGGAKRRVKVDTGNLRAKIVIEPATGLGGFSLRVGTKVFYAPYIEWGTGIFSEHPTKNGRQTPWAFPVPKTGKNKDKYNFKRIEIDGKPYFVTRGSKPHPFLFPSFEEERPKFLANVRRVLNE
jgi:hypothetical protein